MTNSSLVETLCAVALPVWLCWHRTRGVGRAAALGAVLGAAALTQVTALPLAALLLGALLVVAVRARDLRSPLAAVLASTAVCGWWFVRNLLVHGDALATAATSANMRAMLPGLTLIRPHPGLSPEVVATALAAARRSVWYSGGWDQLLLPSWMTTVLGVAALVSLASALRVPAARHLVVVAAVIGGVLAWLSIARTSTHTQGRYLLTGIVGWSAAFVIGAGRLWPRGGGALWVWPSALLAADVYLIAVQLVPHGGL